MADPRRYGPAAPKGRVEVGLDEELSTSDGIGPAEVAALRAQAHAVDLAEAMRDPEAISRASGIYLQLRRAAKLTPGAGGRPPIDPFDALAAALTTAEVRDS